MNKFQETGNKIPVTESELIKFMNLKYTEYYNDNELPNPEKNDVIYSTKDGKTIKIPDEIKTKAKAQWLKVLLQDSQQNINSNEDFTKDSTENNTKDSTNWWNIAIYIIVIIIALYLLYLLSKF